jgi:hypothetical protein
MVEHNMIDPFPPPRMQIVCMRGIFYWQLDLLLIDRLFPVNYSRERIECPAKSKACCALKPLGFSFSATGKQVPPTGGFPTSTCRQTGLSCSIPASLQGKK